MQAKRATAPKQVKFGPLPNSVESLGLVLDFLSRRAPFERFPLGIVAASTRLQLRDGTNIAAFAEGRVIGYVGWHMTTTAAAERWAASDEPIVPVLDGTADAGLITAFASDYPAVVKVLIKGMRDKHPGKRAYFQRIGAPGEADKRKVGVSNAQRT